MRTPDFARFAASVRIARIRFESCRLTAGKARLRGGLCPKETLPTARAKEHLQYSFALAALLCLCLLCPGLVSCAGHSPAVAVGFGSHGLGIGLHEGGGWGGMGFSGGFWSGGSYGGLYVAPGYRGYSEGALDGRIVAGPVSPRTAEESREAWNRYERLYQSPLGRYQGAGITP